jgi:hypothetical protein
VEWIQRNERKERGEILNEDGRDMNERESKKEKEEGKNRKGRGGG